MRDAVIREDGPTLLKPGFLEAVLGLLGAAAERTLTTTLVTLLQTHVSISATPAQSGHLDLTDGLYRERPDLVSYGLPNRWARSAFQERLVDIRTMIRGNFAEAERTGIEARARFVPGPPTSWVSTS